MPNSSSKTMVWQPYGPRAASNASAINSNTDRKLTTKEAKSTMARSFVALKGSLVTNEKRILLRVNIAATVSK